MLRYFRRKISRKILVTVVLATLLATVLAAGTAALRDRNERIRAKEAELNGIAMALAASVAQPMESGDKTAMLRALRAIARIPDISHVRVVGPFDRVVAQMGSDVALAHVEGREAISRLLTGGRRMHVSAPIVSGRRELGQLVMVADASQLSRAFLDTLFWAFIIAALSVIAGVAAANRLVKRIVRPILALTTAMARVRTTGKFDERVTRSSRDETGELVAAFNDMLEHITKRDAELARHREHLEATVLERTRELREARRLADSANAAKSDFLATMSHEIRTPMHGMMAITELLSNTPLSAESRRYVEILTRSGQSLLAIINDVLDLSKIESGKLELEAIAFDPAQSAVDTIALFQERARAQGISLALEQRQPELPWLTGDPVRIMQILSNLVSNAIKFTHEGGVRVEIDVRPPIDDGINPILHFAVHDTGIGIPPDRLDSIFESFTQADQSTTRRYGGTGIGLSITRRLVTAMGGTIVASSEVGKGTTISVTVPLPRTRANSEASQAPAPEVRSTTSFTGRRVLVADDNEINLTVMKDALDALGIETTLVRNGTDAIAAAANSRFDLAFMDCSMPDLDGFEATRRIRARASATSHPRMPIVALTAHAFNGNSEMWRAAGMDDYIVKPFKLSGLADYLTRWIEPVRNADETLRTQSQSADAAPMGDIDILDTAVLDELRAMSGPSGSMLTRVIALYDEHAPVALAKLAAAITGGMQGEVAAQAHALKSLSLNAGAKRAAVLCEALEEASRNGDLSGAASHQLTIAAAIDEAIGALTAYDRADLRSVAA